MKFYVAGSSKLIGWAQLAMAMVHNAGHTVTHDWTKHFETGAPKYFAGDLARQDLQAIDQADAVLFLFNPEHISAGAWTELGYAIRSRKPVFVVVSEQVAMRDMEPYIFLFTSNVVMSSCIVIAIRAAESMKQYGGRAFRVPGVTVGDQDFEDLTRKHLPEWWQRGNVADNSKNATMPPEPI